MLKTWKATGCVNSRLKELTSQRQIGICSLISQFKMFNLLMVITIKESNITTYLQMWELTLQDSILLVWLSHIHPSGIE